MAAPLKYPPELRDRAVRMVEELCRERGSRYGVIAEVARKLGIGDMSLRNWVKQSQIDAGVKPGTTTEDSVRIKELERENRELRRANEILKLASAFFARELDPQPRRQSSSSTPTGTSSGSSRFVRYCKPLRARITRRKYARSLRRRFVIGTSRSTSCGSAGQISRSTVPARSGRS